MFYHLEWSLSRAPKINFEHSENAFCIQVTMSYYQQWLIPDFNGNTVDLWLWYSQRLHTRMGPWAIVQLRKHVLEFFLAASIHLASLCGDFVVFHSIFRPQKLVLLRVPRAADAPEKTKPLSYQPLPLFASLGRTPGEQGLLFSFSSLGVGDLQNNNSYLLLLRAQGPLLCPIPGCLRTVVFNIFRNPVANWLLSGSNPFGIEVL